MRARRDGDIDEAQRLTVEAWALETELDAQFLQPGAPTSTWKDKPALREVRQPIVSKSKPRHGWKSAMTQFALL
ncbi:hypothetical protein WK68_02095 [Burkholderia ubonensis]|uniref:hypothetical protein n=1 Tax=Burkholderia ubonensis TaxID=101571 RepID=UPI00075CADA7|nr:hypothetical protein [Burkholderia ubonensis]KVU36886.1 hypothetical protein WK68_02095 [Burkholderia ubonensis]